VVSKYPISIDGNNELPLATDNVTEVRAQVVNNLRGGIIAVERELGIEPSGIYSTVRARLDALETALAGTGGRVSIQEAGVEKVSAATILNFLSGASITANGSIAEITIAGGGGSGNATQESFSVSESQTSFTLSGTPSENSTVMMFVNGEKQQYGIDYTASGTAITWFDNDFILESTDIVEFWYLVDGGGGGGGGTATLSDVLGLGNTSDGQDIILSTGGDLVLSSSSQIISQGSSISIADSISVSGDATITGIIDGINASRFDSQASRPVTVASGKGLVWVRTDKKLIFTDDTLTDHDLLATASTPTFAQILAAGRTSGSTSPRIDSAAILEFAERAAAPSNISTIGFLWVKNDAPNKLIFTDDTGTDHDVSSGGSLTAPISPTDNNKLTYASSGDLSYASQVKTDGTYLSIGASPASTGSLRLSASGSIVANNSVDRTILRNSTSEAILGSSTATAKLEAPSGQTIALLIGSTTALSVTETAISVGGNKITNLATPTVSTEAATKGYVDAQFITGGTSLASVLSTDNHTDGYNIFLSSGDTITGTNNIVTLDGYVGITHSLVLYHQSAQPASAQPDKSLLWVKNDNNLMYTDENNVTTALTGSGSIHTLAEVLSAGNGTGGNDLIIGNADFIEGQDGYVRVNAHLNMLNVGRIINLNDPVSSKDAVNLQWIQQRLLTQPANPSQDGYVALGLHGSLSYLRGSSTNDVLTWNGSSWVSSASSVTPPVIGDNNKIAYAQSSNLSYSTSLTTDGSYLGLGTPASLPSSGLLRTASGFIWETKLSGGSNRQILDFGSTTTDVLTIGSTSYPIKSIANSSGHTFGIAGTDILTVLSTELTVNNSLLNFTGSNPVIKATTGTLSVNIGGTVAAVFNSATATTLSSALPNYILRLNNTGTALEYAAPSVAGGSQNLHSVLGQGNTTDGYDIILAIGDAIEGADGYVNIDSILSVNSHRIIDVATPVLSTDGVNKSYVDNAVFGDGYTVFAGVSGAQNTSQTSYTAIGAIVIDQRYFTGKTFKFQVVLETTSATVSANIRLFNVNSGSAITSSALSSVSTAAELKEASVTLNDGMNIYEVQLQAGGAPTVSDRVTCKLAQLLIY
jgi:hypothetical protein